MIDRIDINADIGELLVSNRDREILKIVTSANICCGVHAGSAALTRQTIVLAAESGVSVGAHPGAPGSFGRGGKRLAPDDLFRLATEQLSAFLEVSAQVSAPVRHVKLHGSLYNQAESDRESADAYISAVSRLNKELIVYCLAGGAVSSFAASSGLSSVGELFADRSYDRFGRLTPRHIPGAVLTDVEEIAGRITTVCKDGKIRTLEGAWIDVEFETICVHGDTDDAVQIAGSVRNSVSALGVTILSPGSVLR